MIKDFFWKISTIRTKAFAKDNDQLKVIKCMTIN